jgi:L-iditol 2-dehydrogenase
MKSIIISGPRKTKIIETEEPQIHEPNDVKIKVAFAGICPDELPFFRQEDDMLGWGPILYPGNGHEMSGYIVELGEAAQKAGFEVGMRVSGYAWNQCGYCHYCLSGKESHCLNLKPIHSTMSEFIVWHSRQLIKIPDSVSMEEACLTDPIGHSLRGIDRSELHLGDSVLIIGGTLPGLILLQLAKMCGATRITVIEAVEANRKLAYQLGAELCIDPNQDNVSSIALDKTKLLGYDVIFETSCKLERLSLAAALLARQGVIAYSSIYGLNHLFPINTSELFIKEAKLVPFHMAPYMLPRIQSIMEKIFLKPLISHVFSMEESTSAYEATESGQYPHVLIKING